MIHVVERANCDKSTVMLTRSPYVAEGASHGIPLNRIAIIVWCSSAKHISWKTQRSVSVSQFDFGDMNPPC